MRTSKRIRIIMLVLIIMVVMVGCNNDNKELKKKVIAENERIEKLVQSMEENEVASKERDTKEKIEAIVMGKEQNLEGGWGKLERYRLEIEESIYGVVSNQVYKENEEAGGVWSEEYMEERIREREESTYRKLLLNIESREYNDLKDGRYIQEYTLRYPTQGREQGVLIIQVNWKDGGEQSVLVYEVGGEIW